MSEDEPSSAGRQLLYFDQRSASQLLEVYVKRSLSDAGGLRKLKLKSRKCLTPTDGITQARRASSDTSAHRLSIEKILQTSESPKPPRSGSTLLPPRLSSQSKNRKAPETTGRKSFLRAFLHWFLKKGSDTRADVLAPKPESHPSELKADEAPKAVKKKHTFRKPSFRNIEKTEALKKPSPLTPEDVVRLPHAVSVEPSSAYLEKVSEELERIVEEVKISPDEGAAGGHSPAALENLNPDPDETVRRIISLLKKHGDAIDEKIQKNSKVHSFFQRLSYRSFQQLADLYVSEIPQQADRVSHASPELVQLAFTLDFTAMVADLSNQAVSRILGFGNQYLQDRFTQICSTHNQEAGDVDSQGSSAPE